MTILSAAVFSSVLAAAQQERIASFQITQALVSYEVVESTLTFTKKRVIGSNEDLSIDLNVSPGSAAGRLLISSSGFRTGVPLRDRSVRMILKSDEHHDITFDIMKIDGEDLAKVLRPSGEGLALKANLRDLTVDIVSPEKGTDRMVLRAGGKEARIEGKLRDDILNALRAETGQVRVAGKLTVAGASKIFDAAVSYIKTAGGGFSLSTVMDAAFTDFGITPPNVGVLVLSVPDHLLLKGSALITIKHESP